MADGASKYAVQIGVDKTEFLVVPKGVAVKALAALAIVESTAKEASAASEPQVKPLWFDPKDKDVGKKVHAERIARKVGLNRTAARAGIRKATLIDIEKQRAVPEEINLVKIAEAIVALEKEKLA